MLRAPATAAAAAKKSWNLSSAIGRRPRGAPAGQCASNAAIVWVMTVSCARLRFQARAVRRWT